MTGNGTVIAGLLLAAGGGRRLGGRPKALLSLDGHLFVERAAAALRAAGCSPVHVVLGAAADEVVRRAGLTGCAVVRNPGWAEGMGSSLRAGLASLPPGTDAALVALVDQPRIGAAAMARVLAAHGSARTLAAATYGGRRGHPVLLGAAHFDGVAASARGDRGARAYLAERDAEVVRVECGDIAAPDDVDEPEDLIDLPS
ncbi:nucleotidyltransferase family protein [Streptomyces avicenniae]|uniref:nucleotidyltransferase family protein n=1 Tax=Streptomyces avicenniae TaxID=500153 RepID=UPI000699CC71|nr:nucleotidyltransferase family protein [Streptomyces avicenniae]